MIVLHERSVGPRLQHHLDALIFLVLEDVVTVGRFIQGHGVRNHASRVDFAPLNALQQRLHIALHMVYPQNRHLSAKVRVFVEWIAGLLADMPELQGQTLDWSSVPTKKKA